MEPHIVGRHHDHTSIRIAGRVLFGKFGRHNLHRGSRLLHTHVWLHPGIGEQPPPGAAQEPGFLFWIH